VGGAHRLGALYSVLTSSSQPTPGSLRCCPSTGYWADPRRHRQLAGHKYGYRTFDNRTSRATPCPSTCSPWASCSRTTPQVRMSPNFAVRWFEIDPTWQAIRLLARTGLIEIAAAPSPAPLLEAAAADRHPIQAASRPETTRTRCPSRDGSSADRARRGCAPPERARGAGRVGELLRGQPDARRSAHLRQRCEQEGGETAEEIMCSPARLAPRIATQRCRRRNQARAAPGRGPDRARAAPRRSHQREVMRARRIRSLGPRKKLAKNAAPASACNANAAAARPGPARPLPARAGAADAERDAGEEPRTTRSRPIS